ASLAKVNNNLNAFLKPYNIEVKRNILLDASYLPLRSGFQRIPYPYWLLVQNENLNKNISGLADLQAVAFFWASEVVEREVGGVSYLPLASTSNSAWKKEGETISVDIENFDLNNGNSQFHVGLISSGELKSAYSDRTTTDGQLVIIGDSEFISDSYIE